MANQGAYYFTFDLKTYLGGLKVSGITFPHSSTTLVAATFTISGRVEIHVKQPPKEERICKKHDDLRIKLFYRRI